MKDAKDTAIPTDEARDELSADLCPQCQIMRGVLSAERRGNTRYVFLLCPRCNTIDGITEQINDERIL